MDPTQSSLSSNTNPQTAPTELSHITEELYKKNFELDEKNKTLSLLRKIDEIILSAVTDIKQVAQQVADVVAGDAEFEAVMIFLTDKKNKQLTQLAISQTENIKKIQQQYYKPFYPQKVTLTDSANPIARVVQENAINSVQTLHDMLSPIFSAEEINNVAETTGIKSCIIYPFIVRNENIGAIVVCTATASKDFSQYKNDLIVRLVDVVGIAIYNALLYQRIQEANERLKSLDKLKDEFVSLASHELRTPMTAISSYIWLVKKDPNLTDLQRTYLENTYTSVQRLIRLVNDMLNASRIETGRLIIKAVPTSIEEVVKETITELLPKAQEQKITLTEENPATPLPLVLIDKDKIKEVVMNLVGNSLKFTPSGGKITISFSEHDAMVEVHITDTGTGIKKEDMPKLFKKFGMIDENYLKTTPGQGTGLGLYISKSIVQLHGGSIWFESPGVNMGTTFSFSLKKA
ncbi:MAG TPA: GAF domain-containing sensor histidine kinase [Candidatus Saccharimonadales bacterium]|nr:GAF domain-containing sensor histidine kinase [Candidatus Saccharimonadales bacterium]